MSKALLDSPFITALEAIRLLGDDGMRLLFQAHAEGKVTLTGRRGNDKGSPILGERERISSIYVADRVTVDSTNCICADGAVEDFSEFERNITLPRWEDVMVSNREVRVLAKAVRSSMATTITAEHLCERWLIEQMQASERPPHAKQHYKIIAKKQFGVGLRGFDRAWTAAVKNTCRTEWSKAGAKTKQKSHETAV